MLSEVKKSLQNELDTYLSGKADFAAYYPGMNVYAVNLYKEQLREAVELVKKQDEASVNNFKLYLDTIIVNMHTKIKKYKKSIYFNNENVKDIQNQGFTIVFFIDEQKERYILLGILNSEIVI